MSYCKECKQAIKQAYQILFLEDRNMDMTPEECAEMIAYDNGWTCASKGKDCEDTFIKDHFQVIHVVDKA